MVPARSKALMTCFQKRFNLVLRFKRVRKSLSLFYDLCVSFHPYSISVVHQLKRGESFILTFSFRGLGYLAPLFGGPLVRQNILVEKAAYLFAARKQSHKKVLDPSSPFKGTP